MVWTTHPPRLRCRLHGLIKDAVLRPYVLPDKFIMPLVSDEVATRELPRGLLTVTVIEAERVPRMDLLSKSGARMCVWGGAGRVEQTSRPARPLIPPPLRALAPRPSRPLY